MSQRRAKGFTLVELLVVTPGLLIVGSVLIAFLVTLYSDLLVKNAKLELEITAQAALFNVRDELVFANRFAGTNQIDTNDSNQPSGGWNAITHKALIVYEVAFDANRQTVGRQIAYKRNTPHDCSVADLSSNQYATNTLIFFMQDDKLYRRILIPNQSANCRTTFRKQSCPAANSTPACPQDVLIADNVVDFSIHYRDRNDDEIDAATLQATPEQFIRVQRVDVNLSLYKRVAAQDVTGFAQISIKKGE